MSVRRWLVPRVRRVAIGAAMVLAGSAAIACGLSVSGAADGDGAATDAGPDAATVADGASATGDSAPPSDGSISSDAGNDDGASGPDAKHDASCVPFDSGVGALALPAFSLKGSAVYNENNDGKITLTNSNKNERGAAWYPTPLPVALGYDATWSLRVGPGDTAGDGIAFAVIQATAAPGVGDDGDGIGLRNLAAPDGGALAGYAVIVDMFRNPNDATDLGPTTLKIVVMPGFRFVATALVTTPPLNDGNVYAVDVSWRAPTLTATLHAPGGVLVHAASNDPALALTAPALVGFTAATGDPSDSHNEIAGGAVTQTCD